MKEKVVLFVIVVIILINLLSIFVSMKNTKRYTPIMVIPHYEDYNQNLMINNL